MLWDFLCSGMTLVAPRCIAPRGGGVSSELGPRPRTHGAELALLHGGDNTGSDSQMPPKGASKQGCRHRACPQVRNRGSVCRWGTATKHRHACSCPGVTGFGLTCPTTSPDPVLGPCWCGNPKDSRRVQARHPPQMPSGVPCIASETDPSASLNTPVPSAVPTHHPPPTKSLQSTPR